MSAAETLALEALGFIAGDETLLFAFLDTAGLSPEELRMGAGEPEMLAAVLDYLLANEEILLRFAESTGMKPEKIMAARRKLPGAAPEH